MPASESLAIVGMDCRLPGAEGLDSFWKLVVEQGNAWGPLPESRFNRELYFHPEKGRVGKSYSEIGAVVSDIAIDPKACPITAEMAHRYDIAHQHFLEVASRACRDAGMDPFAMPTGLKTGVYVGHTGGSTRIGDMVYATGIAEAMSLLAEAEPAQTLLGDPVGAVGQEVADAVRRRYPGRHPGEQLQLGALGAARIVHEALALSGPYLVVDAACASSLQAIAIGARALLRGSIDQAIVGGASYCKADSLVLFSAAQSVSSNGSCPFGDKADGLVTGEGYVALVIKTLSRAIEDGDKIRAVISGIGVASDGKGKSLWAPRQEGQLLALNRAYTNPVDISRIDYIEAHATSTQVGDETELAALSAFMAPHLKAGRQIPIGSVKANIGHTLETAGLASLIKVILAIENSVIPPGSSNGDLNKNFDWNKGPFTVLQEPIPWPTHSDGSPRQAAVNAFGIGGLNIHLAVCEYIRSSKQLAVEPADKNEDTIAIVGAGCVLPGAVDLDSFFTRIERGESAIGPVPADRWKATLAIDAIGPRTWHTMSDQGGFVREFAYDWRRHKVPPKQIAAANPLQFMLLDAADAAIADAGGWDANLDRKHTSVVVGTLFGGDFANQLQLGLRLPETALELRAVLKRRLLSEAEINAIVEAYEKTSIERMPALIDETGSFTSSTLASRLTKTFDLMGGALAVDAGDCSSVSALSVAIDMLLLRDCDAVICAAGQRSLDLMAFEGLSLNGKFEPTAEAFTPGEGAVVFVLKRLKDARTAGNRIRGIIRRAEVDSEGELPLSAPSLAPLIGHTGAAAAAAELLSLTKMKGEGSITISDGPLIGHLEVGDSPQKPCERPAWPVLLTPSSRPLVAALFPGQGSQYTDMFRRLVTMSDQARQALKRLDILARDLGHETLAEIAWRPDNGLGKRIWDTQWAIYLGDLFAWDVLRDMGFCPDVVTSHSFGEFPALAATAAWTAKDGALATQARAEAVQRHGPRDGAMISVIADRFSIEALIEPFRGQVWVCAENSPEQFVIGGTASVLDEVENLLEEGRMKSKRLAVPSPFHTPLLERAADQLAEAIESLNIRVPVRPIISSTTLETLMDPSGVRASLIRQMTERVRWIDVVEGLHASGVRTFVEVGPSGVLSGLTRRILKGREGCTFLQFDQRNHDGRDPLKRLAEQLEAAGAIPATASGTTTQRLIPMLTGKQPEPTQGTLVFFDATLRRRLRNRVGSSLDPSPGQTTQDALTGINQLQQGKADHDRLSPDHRPKSGNKVDQSNGYRAAKWPNPGRFSGASPLNVVVKPTATTPLASIVSDPEPEAESAEIEALLKDFVVEQTGYPLDIVDLDADLEADLGIDSIRKAQLIGEIGQIYAFHVEDRVSLDEFPTLRHLLDYILLRFAEASKKIDSGPAAVKKSNSDTGHKQSATSNSTAGLLALSQSLSPNQRTELGTFLVDFVVEQTGYPREIVELDADLEADLGIDSIRKAQLLGEIGQTYELKTDNSITIDQFSTLRDLLDYILPLLSTDHSVASSSENASIKEVLTELQPGIGQSLARNPAAALGEFEAMVVIPADAEAPRGLIACFGRHAKPDVRRLESDGLNITLIGAKDVAGALVAWNDAGLIVLMGEATAAERQAVVALVEKIAISCRSIEDADKLISRQMLPKQALTVAHMNNVSIQILPPCQPRSPLHRVALADGAIDPHQALEALLNQQNNAARDALSLTCAWMAFGVADSVPCAVSGSPFQGPWLDPDLCMSGPSWGASAATTPHVPARSNGITGNSAVGNAEVTRRYSLMTHDIGAAKPVRMLAGERVLLLGGGEQAQVLAQAVERLGAIAIPICSGTAAEWIAAVERAEEQGPVRHMIVALTLADADWPNQLDASICTPFVACQRWITNRRQSGDIASSTLTAVVDLGGDFGLSGVAMDGVGGAFSGLLKGIAREYPSLQVRVIDAPGSLTPDQRASSILEEIRTVEGPIEVGLLNGTRVTVVPYEQRPQNESPLLSITAGSVWIATGGARGVTAECACALGRRHGVVFALVGSTTPVDVDASWLVLDEAGLKRLKGRVMREANDQGANPNAAWSTITKSIEIERSLARYRAAGVDGCYYACDLTDEAAVQKLAEQVAREQGPVRGVLHGAGFEAACRFEKKTLAGLVATIGPKCIGIEHLLAALDPKELEAVVGFGSTSGRLGGHGQADYAMANDMLAKILGTRRRTGLRTTVIHWHAWDSVGMANRPESRYVLEQFGLTFMPLAEGIRRFLDEIEAGLPEAEVLITEPAFVRGALPMAAILPPPFESTLLTNIEVSAEAMRAVVTLDPEADRFLREHRLKGRPILPAVMGIQLLLEAAKAVESRNDISELREFIIHSPIVFATPSPRTMRIQVQQREDGGMYAEVLRQVPSAMDVDARPEHVHLEGTMVFGRPKADVPVLLPPPLPLYPMIYPEDAPIWHGSSFRTLTGLFLDRSGGWGSLVAPKPSILAEPRQSDGWSLPAALVDGCLVACGIYSYVMCGQRREIPERIDRLCLFSDPHDAELCTVRLHFINQGENETRYNLFLYGADSRPLLALNGLQMAKIQ